MTHGDQAKAKKAASKASGSKKSSKAVEASQPPKSGKSAQAGKEGGGKKAEVRPKAGEVPKKQQSGGAKAEAVPKAVAGKTGSNGKSAPRPVADASGFSNPIVGAAFRRALKKYPNAFRRLTD
jgi:hypothetical protein